MADRYWVGGTGSWDLTTTTNWSATNGGAGGASAPTSADDVFFTSSSGSTFTVTIAAAGAACRSINVTGTVGMTLAGTGTMTVSGSFTLPATGLTWSHTGALNFAGTSLGSAKNITTNGVSIAAAVTFGSTSGSDAYTLQSAFTTTGAVTHTFGTLDINSYTLTGLTYASSNSNTRVLAFGASGIINVSGTGTVWNTATLTGFSFTGTSNVRLTNAGSTAITITPGAGTSTQLLNFAITAGTYALTISGSSNVSSLNFTGFSGSFTLGGTVSVYGDVTLSSTTTSTAVAQTLSFAGNGATVQNFTTAGRTIGCSLNFTGGSSVKLIGTLTQNTSRSFTLNATTLDINSQTTSVGILTINAGTKSILNGTLNCVSVTHTTGDLPLTSTGTVVSTGTYTFSAGTLTLGANATLTTGAFSTTTTSTRSIAFGTSSTIVVTGTGSAWTATQTSGFFTYTGTSNIRFTYNGAAAMTVNATGSTTAQALNMYFTAGTYSLTLSTGSVFNDLDFTGFGGTYAQAATNATVFGNLVFSSTMSTTTTSGIITMGATSGTRTITTNGITLSTGITFNGVGGTFQLSDNFSQSATAIFGITNGTIDFNNKVYSLGAVSINSTQANYTLLNYGSILSAASFSIGAATTIGSGLNITTTGRITVTSFVLTIANGITLTAGTMTVQGAGSGVAFGTGAIELTGSGTIWDSSLGSPGFSGSQIVRVTYSGSVSSSIATGTTARLNFFFTAGTYSLSMAGVGGIGSLDFTGFSGTLSQTSTVTSVYGDIVFSPTMTTTTNVTPNMVGTGTRTITSNGMVYQGSFNFNSSGATFRLADNFSQGSGGSFTLTNGTVDFNNVTYTLGILTFVSGISSYINFGSVLNPPAAITLTSGTLNMGSGSSYLQTAGAFTFTAGTLNINDGIAFNVGSFVSSNTNTRVINFSPSSSIQTTGTGAVWNVTGVTGLSHTGTSNILISNATATATTVTNTGTSTNAMNFSFTTGTYTLTLTSGGTWRNLDFTGFSGTWAAASGTQTMWGNLTLGSTMSTTGTTGVNHLSWTATSGTRTIITNGVTANFGIAMNGAGQTLQLGSAIAQGTGHNFTYTAGTFDIAGYSTSLGTFIVNTGTHSFINGSILCAAVTHTSGDLTIGAANGFTCSGFYTFTAGSITINDGVTLTTGAFTSSNTNTRSIAFGTGKITVFGTGSIWTLTAATGFSFTGTSNITMLDIVGGASGAKTVINTGTALNFNFINGDYPLTLGTSSVFLTIDFTGFSGTWAQGSTNQTIFGNLIYSGTMTTTNTTGILTIGGSTDTTITSNGLTANTIRHTIQKTVTTAKVTLTDAFTSTGPFVLAAGVFDTASYNFTALGFTSTGALTRTLTMGSSVVTITGSGTSWNVGTTLTVSASTSTINMSAATAKTFAGAGKTYYNLNQTGAGTLTITGSNTFNAIGTPITSSSATTVILTAGTTTTVSDLSMFKGTAGRLLTLQSSVAGTQATISDASGTVTVYYVSIRDSNATGGATFRAPLNYGNVNVSNNTGWDFSNIFGSGVNTNFFVFF